MVDTVELSKDQNTPNQEQIHKFTDIHPRNPMYLYPYDTPSSILVSQQLIGIKNYTGWSNSMKVALLGKTKIGFIDGKCHKGDTKEI